MSKITAELLRKIEETKRMDPKLKIAVVVTFDAGLDISDLEKLGLQIENEYPEINAVAGIIPANAVKRLSDLQHVKAIEYDSEVHAL